MPELLVSVRDAAEAAAAFAGGADVIDVKEPDRGSLGVATPAAWNRVLAAADGRVPVSVALGEVGEWGEEEGVTIPPVPPGVAFVKLGLAGQVVRSTWSDWTGEWLRVRSAFDAAGGRPLPWVAVAYADHAACAAPGPASVIAAAARTGCVAVLFDTFLKDGRGLFDHQPPGRVAAFGERIRAAGMRLALAGSLRADDFPTAIDCGADILAVRGAACVGGREGRVEEGLVRGLRCGATGAVPDGEARGDSGSQPGSVVA